MKHSTALAAVVVAMDAGADVGFSVSREIERFLDGETDGSPLFHALYDDVADEPIPERLLAILRNRC
jgi:Anti-sigma factor NepR